MKHQTSNLTEQVIGGAVVVGIITGICTQVIIDNITFEQYVEVARAEEPEVEPREVRIEVIYNWTPERIEEEIRKVFPEDPEIAVAIAWAESEMNVDAYNPEFHEGCAGSIGIMQIACVHHRNNPRELHDVLFNLQKAREVYEDSLERRGNGWLPWGAYTDGRYQIYLK